MTRGEACRLLGVDAAADKRTVRHAYAALTRAHHEEDEPELFAQISEAYRILTSDARGSVIDRTEGQFGTADAAGKAGKRPRRSTPKRTAHSDSETAHETKETARTDSETAREMEETAQADDAAGEKDASSSYLARLDSSEQAALDASMQSGALGEIVARLQDPKQKNSRKDWEAFFLSDRFLEEQLSGELGMGLYRYVEAMPYEEQLALPKAFVAELAVAYGLMPMSWEAKERAQDGSFATVTFYGLEYRPEQIGSARDAAAWIYHTVYPVSASDKSRFLYSDLVKKEKNRVRIRSSQAYLLLRRLHAAGRLDMQEKESFDELLNGGRYYYIYEMTQRDSDKFTVLSASFIRMLTWWIGREKLDDSFLAYLYDKYELKSVGPRSALRTIYEDLKTAVTACIPIEATAYQDDVHTAMRHRFLKGLQEVMARFRGQPYETYEDTEESIARTEALFSEENEDWTALRDMPQFFEAIYRLLIGRDALPPLLCDKLLMFYSTKQETFAQQYQKQLQELLFFLLECKNHLRCLQENDPRITHTWTHTAVSDISVRNTAFMEYLLEVGYGKRTNHQWCITARLDSLYVSSYTASQHLERNHTDGWRMAFLGYDEKADVIPNPPCHTVTLPDGHTITAEFHLHYILWFWDGTQVVQPYLPFAELLSYEHAGIEPLAFLYLLAVTRITRGERREAQSLIYEKLSQTGVEPLLFDYLSETLALDNAWERVAPDEHDGLKELLYFEQMRFCYLVAVREHSVSLYQDIRISWREMLPDAAEEAQIRQMTPKEQRTFYIARAKALLQGRRKPLETLDLRGRSDEEKLQAIIETAAGRSLPDALTQMGKQHLYAVVHLGENEGSRFDRLFWIVKRRNSFPISQLGENAYKNFQGDCQNLQKKIREPYDIQWIFGIDSGHAMGFWTHPRPIALGESGRIYSYVSYSFHVRDSVSELPSLLAEVIAAHLPYGGARIITSCTTYAGELRICREDENLIYTS